MSDTTNPAMIDESASRFPSFAPLRTAHSELLKRHRESGNTPEFLAEVETFIRRGQATGALLDAEDDRWASQSLLDYWVSMMYRAGHEPPEATLAEFDPALAPELDDVLCPYVGLDAFREGNHNVFFGRQRLVEEMVGWLKENSLLAVVGASGSGKSSLVRAGLLPALKAGAVPGSQGWHYYPTMVPGSSPLANLVRLVLNELIELIEPSNVDEAESVQHHLARCQQEPGHLFHLINEFHRAPIVLVVDQFEELFTLCDDDSVRQAFIDNLLGLVQSSEASEARHIVILTMRIDFEPHVARLPTFQPLFEEAQVRVTPLNAGELREAIEGPAELVGLKFEEGVVDALLQDILGEPAALPLLQFTLLKLWESREHNRVTWEAYRRLGGGRLALARSADQFYEGLIPEEQMTTRRILLRMVRPGEGLEITSNRIRRQTLYQAGEARDRIDRVLDKLVQARLVCLTKGDTLADVQVEVAHEALVRNWPRLVDWLEEEREEMRRRLRLTAAAEQWAALGRDTEALLRGSLLDEALRYEDLNELEDEFVRASQAAVEEARRKEEEARQRELEQAQRLAEEQRRRAEAEHQRAEEQARAARRLRLLLAALAAVFLLAVGTAVVVVKQTRENVRLAAEAAAAGTQAAVEAELVAALDAQATSVAELATAEARGDQVFAAEETVQASQATVVAARETAQSGAMLTPTTLPTQTPLPTATPTPTATPALTPTPTFTPTPTPTLSKVAVANQEAAILAAPDAESAVLGFVKVGESVTVLGRSVTGSWLYILGAAGVEGFVYQLYFDWPGDLAALPTRRPTVTVTVTPAPGIVFAIEHLGCQTHSSTLGSVKGQVFDAAGDVIPGAQVEIWIDGARWDDPANPARTNKEGWYEWTLSLDQTIRFVALYVDDLQMAIEPQDFEVQTVSGCFQHVNLRQRRVSCGLLPDALFATAYAAKEVAARLDCPVGEATVTIAAFQPFEQGLMFWRGDLEVIYVLYAYGRWTRYDGTWDKSQPDDDPSLTPPIGLQQPRRGFGKVWREQLGGPEAEVGWARELEREYKMWVQSFGGGEMFVGAEGDVFILYADWMWERGD